MAVPETPRATEAPIGSHVDTAAMIEDLACPHGQTLQVAFQRIGLGVVQHRHDPSIDVRERGEQVKLFLQLFLGMVGGGLLVAWLMYPFPQGPPAPIP